MNELIKINNWTLTKIDETTEPMIADLELATRLGYAKPANIRQLIKRMVDAKQLGERCCTVQQRPESGGKEFDVYYLTETQSLKVIARSKTDVADKILDEVIAVYMAYRRGLLSPVVAPSLTLSEQRTAIMAALQRQSSAGSLEAAALWLKYEGGHKPAEQPPQAKQEELPLIPHKAPGRVFRDANLMRYINGVSEYNESFMVAMTSLYQAYLSAHAADTLRYQGDKPVGELYFEDWVLCTFPCRLINGDVQIVGRALKRVPAGK
jgi:hypothetical protein